MTTEAELPVEERLLQLIQHLGIQRARGQHPSRLARSGERSPRSPLILDAGFPEDYRPRYSRKHSPEPTSLQR